MQNPRRLSLQALAATLLVSALPAQEALEVFASGLKNDLFGNCVRTLPDLNGDGVAELGVGAYGVAPGRLHVFSGLDGSKLYNIKGNSKDKNSFAWSFDTLGDVDGDGVPELVVGAMKHGVSSLYLGRVAILSGADGSEISEVLGQGDQCWFGYSVAGLGDVDGDGWPDWVAGAPYADLGAENAGRVRVVSGRTGANLHVIEGTTKNGWYGWKVAGLGDVDGDDVPDFVVGAPREGGGRIRVHSGATGAVLFTRNGPNGSEMGRALRAAGDLDGDGVSEILVGAEEYDGPGGEDSGLARVYSGATGDLLLEYAGKVAGGRLGWAVSPAGDVDADGDLDYAVSSYGPGESASVRFFEGRTGKVLRTVDGPNSFGTDLDLVPDLTDDGYPELLAGAQQSEPHSYGSAFLLVGHPGEVVGSGYCAPAVSNSTGGPGHLFASGSAVVAQGELWLFALGLPPGRTSLLLASESTAYVPFAGGGMGSLCLGGSILRFEPGTSGARGTELRRVDLASFPTYGAVQVGDTWRFQVWYRDEVIGIPTSNFTDATSILFE